MSNLDPTDIIDLTQDSPINKAFRTRSRSGLRTGTRSTRKNDRSKHRKPPTIELTVHEGDWNDGGHQCNHSASMEIIDLDTTVAQGSPETCIFDDSTKGNLIVLTCPICLETLSSKAKPTSTKCGHIFCANCLDLAMQKSKKCPTCQMPIKTKSFTRLYF